MSEEVPKGNKNANRWIMPGVLAAAGLLLLVLIFRIGFDEPEPTKLNVGFVVIGDVHRPGWNASHYEGLLSACNRLGMNLVVRDNVAEFSGKCIKAVRDLVRQDCRLIILGSYSYSDEMRRYLEEFPNVSFISMTSKFYAPNMATYSARFYQGRYLAGALAGMRSKAGVIGYVAAFPTPEVLRDLNAFLLGARRTNPKARVVVAWSRTWESPEIEGFLAERLIREAGADFITYHQDDAAAAEAADRLGVESILYNAPIPETLHHAVAAINCRWDVFYQNILRNYLKGELRTLQISWIGVESNAVLLTSLSPNVTTEMRATLDAIRQELVRHKMIFHGPLYDNKGVQRCRSDENVGDDTLLMGMDWLISGVTSLE